MSSAEVVRAFWERMEARDWDGARALLADDAVVRYPVTDEVFRDGDAYVAMNRAYPEGWHIEVQTVRAEGPDVLALVRVPHQDGVSWCTERSRVVDGRIAEATGLWVDEATEAAPEWRRPYWAALPSTLPTDPTQGAD